MWLADKHLNDDDFMTYDEPPEKVLNEEDSVHEGNGEGSKGEKEIEM